MIFKFLIVSILIIYLLARFWGFIYRVIAAFQGKDPTGKFQQTQNKPTQKYETRSEGDLKIFIPKKGKKGNRSKEGEYVDYKDIKED